MPTVNFSLRFLFKKTKQSTQYLIIQNFNLFKFLTFEDFCVMILSLKYGIFTPYILSYAVGTRKSAF